MKSMTTEARPMRPVDFAEIRRAGGKKAAAGIVFLDVLTVSLMQFKFAISTYGDLRWVLSETIIHVLWPA